MASSRSTNTFSELLVKQLQSLAAMKAEPDATPGDIAWIMGNLEMPILKKIREPIDTAPTAYPAPQPGVMGGGAIPPELAMAASPGAMPGGGGPMPTGMMGSPNTGGAVDELRRVMGGA